MQRSWTLALGSLLIATLTVVAWRIAVPGLGPVISTADLERTDGGTRLRLRWAYQGASPAAVGEVARFRAARERAIERLARVVAGALPVVE